MLYKTFTVDGKDYKCKLTASACVDLERKLGTNPLNIFMKDDLMPTLSSLLLTFHASLTPLQHDIDFKDACAIYDKYIEEGGNMADFTNVILDIFKASGFVPENVEGEPEVKNA